MDDLLEKELKKPSLIKNPRILDLKYIPKKLLHREDEQKMLIKYFKPVIEDPGKYSQNVTIIGPVGTGKTAIALKFGEMIKVYSARKNLNLEYVHVNCRRARSAFLTLLEVARKFNPNISVKKFLPDEIINMLVNLLSQRNSFLIITLDEIDFIIRKEGSDFLYDMTRLTDDKLDEKERISLITIARESEFRKLLDDSTLSTLRQNIISLVPYNEDQLRDIIKDRANEAFYEDTVSAEAIDLISDITSRKGDTRFAIELLERAGMYADHKQSLKVLPEHVRHANALIHPSIGQEIVTDLTIHQQIILLAIAKQLLSTNNAYVTLVEVKTVDRELCKDYMLPISEHALILENLQHLEYCNLIAIKYSKKEKKKQQTLISLLDVSAEIIKKTIKEQLQKTTNVVNAIKLKDKDTTEDKLVKDVKKLLKISFEGNFFDVKRAYDKITRAEMTKDIIALVNSSEENDNTAYAIIGIVEINQKFVSAVNVEKIDVIEQKIVDCIKYNTNRKINLQIRKIRIYELYLWQQNNEITDEIVFKEEQKKPESKEQILVIQLKRESRVVYELAKKTGSYEKGRSWKRIGSHTDELTQDDREKLMKL